MEEIQRRGLEMRARYFEFLDGRFAGEVRDGPWASSMEQKAKDVLLDPDLAGNKLEQITCQRTLCKMTVTHADFTARGEFISFAGRVPELPNATYRQVTDELGRMTTVAFFARQGFNIPPPPDELVRKNAPP
jgi:hypothetical protein